MHVLEIKNLFWRGRNIYMTSNCSFNAVVTHWVEGQAAVREGWLIDWQGYWLTQSLPLCVCVRGNRYQPCMASDINARPTGRRSVLRRDYKVNSTLNDFTEVTFVFYFPYHILRSSIHSKANAHVNTASCISDWPTWAECCNSKPSTRTPFLARLFCTLLLKQFTQTVQQYAIIPASPVLITRSYSKAPSGIMAQYRTQSGEIRDHFKEI